MNFEKVEIYGFKSFADKVEIKFNDGITGIVGPNGCGKSNVSDAIRWVLGEQSAKNLRGSSMQDVIFSGTQNRKSLSYCEVSLFFDNSTKIFDVDYNQVIITRKLYRSGESEYFINKQQARLKDIVSLLHQCGIGKEGYTIIGQGKVEEIISAKPEDRRAIFEEATGIAHFKTRKIESERKLDRTHENIVRYSDILSEIENQLAPLERQAAKAKEFNELSEELKRHEINTYIAKVDGVETAKGKIYVKIKAVDDEYAQRERELNKAQTEYDKIFNEINEADDNLRNLNAELLEKRVNMEKSSGQIRLFKERISYFEGQVQDNLAEIERNKNTVKESGETIAKNKSDLQNAQADLMSLEKSFEVATKQLVSVSEKIALGEELATANTRKVIESLENLTDIKVNKGTMSIEKSNLLEKRNELTDKLDEYSVKREKAFNDKETIDQNISNLDRNIFETKNNIELKEEEVQQGNEEVSKIDNKIFLLNNELARLEQTDKMLKSFKENHEGFAFPIKTLLNNAKSNPELNKRIVGVVAELIKYDKKYELALARSLSAAAQNVVTNTPEDAKYLIKYLKANDIGKATFLPITSVKMRENGGEIRRALSETGALGIADEVVKYNPAYKSVITNLLANTLIVDTLDNATKIAEKYRFNFKIVTLEGEVFSTQGSMTGGSEKGARVDHMSADRRIEENLARLNGKKAELEELRKQKTALESKRDKAFDELHLLNDLYTQKHQSLILEREKLKVVENTLSDLDKDIENLNELIESVNVRLGEIDEKYRAVEGGSKRLEADKETAQISASKHQKEFDALKKERDDLSEQSTKIQIDITSKKASIQTLKEDISRLERIVNDCNYNIKTLEENVENQKQIIENLKLDEEKVAFSKEEQEVINSIRDKIDGIESNKLSLREQLNKNDERKNFLTEELSRLTEKKNDQKIALAKIDSDLEYLQQSIWEDYQETYETAVKYREEGYDATHGEQEINRIRRKRNSLGAINAQAIDDCKALKERYDEMITQKEDLIKAENDLKEAIEKIKAEMLTQFNEGFVKINENFQKIFKELFGGGRAMLELDYTNVEDKLEAGVEIIAEPPGKKLQKLSLLSGGEKALTTIAILFSILKLRPMPFCVLDEIEAALDEANVDRFASYLKNFSQDTQFIVITHKKPTMEKSDALFGVTMQEKGVSKIVSVKLSDIEDIDDLKKKAL